MRPYRSLLSAVLALILLAAATTPVLAASWQTKGAWTLSLEGPDAPEWQHVETWTLTLMDDWDGLLTIIPGASGAWVEGGYNFNGTGYATRDGFKPLDGLTAFTISIWFVPHTNDTGGGGKLLLSQYINASYRVEIIQVDSSIITRVSVGGSTGNVPNADVLTAGHLIHLSLVYESGDNLRLYVNGSLNNLGTILTGAVTADADLYLGAQKNGLYPINSTAYSVRIYTTALDADAHSLLYTIGTSIGYGSPLWYWMMDEGNGTLFYPNQPTWFYGDHWSLDLYGYASFATAWQSTDTATVILMPPDTAPPLSHDLIGAWIPLVGIALFVGTPSVFAFKLKRKHVTMNDVGMLLIGVGMGLALLLA